MNSPIKNIYQVELSNDELDNVAGGFASNTNISKSISDAFKGQNLPLIQPNFVNFDGSQNNYNKVVQHTSHELIHPIVLA